MRGIVKYAIYFTLICGASLGTTIAVTRIQDNFAAQARDKEDQTTDTDEDEPINKTPNDYFIDSLTSMEHLKGELNCNISFGEQAVTITGNLDLNLYISELSKTQAKANLNIDAFGINENLTVTYTNETIFVDLLNNHIKLNTASLDELVELIKSFNIPMQLPEEFKNIEIESILTNLGNMKYTESSDKITYEFVIFENQNPIIFTSDLNYNLTSVSVKDFAFGDIKISLDATTQVLTENIPIEDPSLETHYTDLTGYYGILKDVSEIVNAKKFGAEFTIDANREETSALKISGNAMVDYENLDIAVNANIFAKQMNSTIFARYTNDENVYVNYNNVAKLKYTKQGIEDLINKIKSHVNSEALDALSENMPSITIPLIDLIKEGKYSELFAKCKNIQLADNQIVLNLPNNLLLVQDETNVIITINFDKDKITNLTLENLLVDKYSFKLEIKLSNYEAPTEPSNPDEYDDLGTVNNLLDNIFELEKTAKFGLDITGSIDSVSMEQPITIDGEIQMNLENLKNAFSEDKSANKELFTAGRVKIVDNKMSEHNLKIDVYDYADDEITDIEKSKAKMYFVYNDKMKGSFSLKDLRSLINLLTTLLNSSDPRIKQYIDALTSGPLFTIINAIKEGNYENALISGLINSLEMKSNYLALTISGKLFGQKDRELKIRIDYEEYKLSKMTISGNLFEMDLNLCFNLKEFNFQDSEKLNLDDTYTDFSDLNILMQYLVNTASLDIFHLSGDLTIGISLIGIKAIKETAHIDMYISIDDDEKVRVAGSLTNIPTNSLINADTLNCGKRSCEFYYDGANVPDYIYMYATQKENPLLSKAYDHGAYAKVDSEHFVTNILQYLCGVGLGLSDSIINEISTSEERSEPIKYEELINDFKFDSDLREWFFNLNLAEIANNEDMDDLLITLKGNEDYYFESVDIVTGLEAIKIVDVDLELKANLTYENEEFPKEKFDNYIIAHANDTTNEIIRFGD